MVDPFLDFKEPIYCSPSSSLHSRQQGRRGPFSPHPTPQHLLFDNGHSDQCEVIPHSFGFHFSSS